MPCSQVSWEDCRALLWKPQPLLPWTLTELFPISGVLLYCIPTNQGAQQTGSFLQCSSLNVSSKIRTLTFWEKKISASRIWWWMLCGRHSVNSFSPYPVGTGEFHFSEPSASVHREWKNTEWTDSQEKALSLQPVHPPRSKCTCELVSNVSLRLRVSSWRATARMACSACSSVLPLATYFGKTYLLCTLGWPVLTYLRCPYFTRALVL